MKKIYIYTIQDNLNYGNRLQNYAMQVIIQRIDSNVKTVKVDTTSRVMIRYNNNILSRLFRKTKTLLKNIISLNLEKRLNELRKCKFDEFTNKYIQTISNYEPNEFDYLIVGSDQVWNPYFSQTKQLLLLDKKGIKNSYAASFGIDTIPFEMNMLYYDALSVFRNISVREIQGLNILKNLNINIGEVHLDPTLILEKEAWITIKNDYNKKPSTPYLVCFYLGKLSREYKDFIIRFSKKNNLQVLYLNSLECPETYDASPNEFIDAISNASFICTDSFHGVAFSVIFEKQFIVFNRIDSMNMNNRINSLFKILDIKSRYFHDIEDLDNPQIIDYDKVNSILEIERKKSMDYLRRCLDE